ILPSLSREESIDVTRIHSVAGVVPEGAALVGAPPFRAPHHGISAAGLIGGGARPTPGEISPAHRGVLLLPGPPQSRPRPPAAIRQPREEGRVTVVRVGGACVFPSDFLLVAAMTPCPCGFLGDPRRPCACDAHERRRYGRKLSGPLLDRIDLHVAMAAVPWRDLGSDAGAGMGTESSAAIRERVSRAREAAAARAPGVAGFRNADLPAHDLVQHPALDRPARGLLETGVTRLRLSVRALHRALRVARTIADLEESDRVAAAPLAEALSFRDTGLAQLAPCPVDQD